MNISYDRQTLMEGNRQKEQAKERPTTFAEYNGAVEPQPTGNLALSNQSRMAGQKGARALELMQNPNAAMAVNEWMNLFGQSNQGQEFNAAKMQQAMQADELAITNKELGRK